jgi:prevent-host-death family protein
MIRMNSKNTMSITEARRKIFEISEKVQKPKTVFFLTQNGKAKAVIMSVDEFDSWAETLDIMSDKKLMKQLREAEKNFRMGNYVPLEDILPESKKKYALRYPVKSGKKRS